MAWLEASPKRIVIVNAATGTHMSHVELKQGVYEYAPRLALDGGDLLYLDNQLVALDVETGRERWRTARDFSEYASLAAAGQVYVFDSDGQLEVHDRAHGELLWDWSIGADAVAVTLPDASGTRPLVLQSESGLETFLPNEKPVPVERAVFTGHVFNRTPTFKADAADLKVGLVDTPIDAHGNYRVGVAGRGTIRLQAPGVGAGYIAKHHVRGQCRAPEDCPVLVPLTGKGRYRVDLDIAIVPEDCH